MNRPDPQVWEALLSYLRSHYRGTCRHWFDDIEPMGITGGTMRLLVREQVQLKYLQKCCVDQFTEAAQAATGRLLAVRFVGEDEEDLPAAGQSYALPSTGSIDDDDTILSPDHTFENFIKDQGNELAYAAAMAVAQQPGRAYNPLFIHGGVGLGKTHLLQAISQTAQRNNRHMVVYYTTCNSFITKFHDAVQAGQMSQFRHRFRHVDMLVIDDIHDLSKRDRTQEEFFHSFNALHQAGKQVVLSSDAAPNEIPALEERLTSRFGSGLVARVNRPGYETRIEIVTKKAELRNIQLPLDVATYIAAKIDTNIRDLEGAITKVHFTAQTTNAPIDLKLAKRAIGDRSGSLATPHTSVQGILDAITGYYDVKLNDLLSKRRHKSIALPRQVGMYLARRHTRYSLEEIGAYFGGRDHTTVMHAIKTVNERKTQDSAFAQDITRIEEAVLDRRAGDDATEPNIETVSQPSSFTATLK